MGNKRKGYIFDNFAYYLEDLDCAECLYSKICKKQACRYEDIKREAIKKGRIKRPKSWFGRYGEKWKDQ
jgi:hypothetical protein